MTDRSPAEVSAQARAAVHRSWANTDDHAARMRAAWAAREARFEKLADPEGVLPPAVRAAKAAALRAAFYAEMARKALAARRAKAAGEGAAAKPRRPRAKKTP